MSSNENTGSAVKTRYAVSLTVVAFLLHLVWENAQAPLYAGYESFRRHFPACFWGAAGDVLITILVLAFMSLLGRGRARTARDFTALAAIGFVAAVAVEERALLFGKWSYAPAMPVIPWLGAGLLPVLQMTLLLPLSFYLAGFFETCFGKAASRGVSE